MEKKRFFCDLCKEEIIPPVDPYQKDDVYDRFGFNSLPGVAVRVLIVCNADHGKHICPRCRSLIHRVALGDMTPNQVIEQREKEIKDAAT